MLSSTFCPRPSGYSEGTTLPHHGRPVTPPEFGLMGVTAFSLSLSFSSRFLFLLITLRLSLHIRTGRRENGSIYCDVEPNSAWSVGHWDPDVLCFFPLDLDPHFLWLKDFVVCLLSSLQLSLYKKSPPASPPAAGSNSPRWHCMCRDPSLSVTYSAFALLQSNITQRANPCPQLISRQWKKRPDVGGGRTCWAEDPVWAKFVQRKTVVSHSCEVLCVSMMLICDKHHSGADQWLLGV